MEFISIRANLNLDCCTDHDCSSPRDQDPSGRFGTLCFKRQLLTSFFLDRYLQASDHQQQFENRIADKTRAEFRRKEEEEAFYARAEAPRRQTRRHEQEARDRERHEPRQPATDTGRRSEPSRPAHSPLRQPYGGREGLRPMGRRSPDNEYEDEGYHEGHRSYRSSGQSFGN